MDRLGRIIMSVWCVMALASFIISFWMPLVPKIIGILFGVLNVGVIINFIIELFEGDKENVQLQEEKKDDTSEA